MNRAEEILQLEYENRKLREAFNGATGYVATVLAREDRFREALEEAKKAFEYIACEDMDDGDFYAEEYITEGTISMANRARSWLEKWRGKL